MLQAAGLRKAYRDMPVFDGLDLHVGSAETVALVGPNGAGKSTLLECLAGAVALDDGSISIDGAPSNPSSESHWKAVYGILDDFTWLPDLTVVDHLRLMSPDGDADGVTAALAAFGAAGIRDRLPESLSAGQRQRAALATAHVRPWQVLLLDEPENHLDTDGIAALVRELTLMARPGRCIVLSSHSPELIDQLGCGVVSMAPQDRV